MDELTKTEARNYLSAAGFFIIFAVYLLMTINNVANGDNFIAMSSNILVAVGFALLVIATLLIVLRKRDMIAILFIMIGFLELFWIFNTSLAWSTIIAGYILLITLVTLTSKDKQKWLLFLLPLVIFVLNLVNVIVGYNATVNVVGHIIILAITIYYAFCCASERLKLPGRKFLTADEQTDFKASGSVLGYMLFAIVTGGYALYYILGEAILPLETFISMELICGALMIFVAILLIAIGKMRFTPIMFLLLGLTNILSIYSTGYMWIGIGILFIIIGLFAMLRKESRILPGIMLIVYGCTCFFTVYANGAMISAPIVSVILNAIPCLIAIYLSFMVYSQRKLPKF